MAKKGTSPLAWIVVGCISVMVLGGLVFTVLTLFAVKVTTGLAEGMENNPTAVLARGVAMADPDIDFVDLDQKAATVTFVNNKSGEELSVSYDDLKNGKLSWDNPAGQAELKTKAATEPGRQSFGNAVDIPDWLSIYPETTPVGVASSTSEESSSCSVQMQTADEATDVVAWYQDALRAEGFVIQDTVISKDGKMTNIAAHYDEDGTELQLSILRDTEKGETRILLSYDRPH